MELIFKYKMKAFKHRLTVPLVKKFEGRSQIAKKKIRNRGRFVKQAKKIFNVLI
jgi:hypothetical protein